METLDTIQLKDQGQVPLQISDYQYRVLDRHIQLDAFIGLDSDDTFLESMISHGRDLDNCCLGFHKGSMANMHNLVDDLVNSGELIELCKNKRVMFVRAVDCKKNTAVANNELESCIALFLKLRAALGENAFFYIALSESLRPLLPPGMYYAHLNVRPDTPQNMFKRLMMSTIGQLLLNQTTGSGLIPSKGRKFSAALIEIPESHSIEIFHDKEVAYKIFRKNVAFEMYCNLKHDSNILVVIGQSALDRQKTQLPAFRRWSWSHEMKYSCIILNDPTLYLSSELEGGWFVGDRKHHYIVTAANIINEIADKANIPTKNIIFMGASAGGFTSLIMASCLEGASAYVDVPQTDLRLYCHKKPLENIASASFSSNNIEACYKQFSDRFSVIDFYKKINRVPNIYYLQNSNDITAGHVSSQFGTFINGLMQIMATSPSSRKAKIVTETYDRSHLLRGGHFPLPKKLTLHYLDRAVSMFCT